MVHSRDRDDGGDRRALPEKRRVSVSFDRSDYDELRRIAAEKRVSLAWVVRDAVATYIYRRSPLFRAPPSAAGPAHGPET